MVPAVRAEDRRIPPGRSPPDRRRGRGPLGRRPAVRRRARRRGASTRRCSAWVGSVVVSVSNTRTWVGSRDRFARAFCWLPSPRADQVAGGRRPAPPPAATRSLGRRLPSSSKASGSRSRTSRHSSAVEAATASAKNVAMARKTGARLTAHLDQLGQILHRSVLTASYMATRNSLDR